MVFAPLNYEMDRNQTWSKKKIGSKPLQLSFYSYLDEPKKTIETSFKDDLTEKQTVLLISQYLAPLGINIYNYVECFVYCR